MPVAKVTLNYKGCLSNTELYSGTVTSQFVVDWEGSETAEYMVVGSRAASAGGVSIPPALAPHPATPWAYVQNIGVTPGSGPKQWIVTVTYKSFDDPFAVPWQVSWSQASSNEPIDRDIYDAAITNSAKETFDPPISKEVDDLILRVTRNEPSFDPLLALQYKNALNNDWFYGTAPGIAKVNVLNGDRQIGGPVLWFIVNYEIQFRKDGWKRRILDQGFRTFDGEDYTTITDSEGNPMSEPTLLDGAGQKLAAAYIAAPVFKEFDVYKSLPFVNLNL